jgi:signal transduction histidine kinase
MSEDDPRGAILGEVIEQVKRLDKTVNDLLFFGKPSLPELTWVDINTIITTTLKFASQHSGGANIERKIELLPDLPPVYADDKQMQQVFLNIVLNAYQAMPSGGTLSITSSLTIRNDIEYVRVDISDTGSGIPPQILEKIFTPFYTTKAQGTGLGLPICNKLVKLHKGDIRVTSDNTAGTVFTIELPARNLGSTDVSEVTI